MSRILRLSKVIDKSGYRRSSIIKKVKEGTFPAPVKLDENGRSVGWIESEIEEWIAKRIEASRNGGAK